MDLCFSGSHVSIPNSGLAKDGNKHSIQEQGWSPGEKAKEPQVGGRAAGSQGMPEDFDAQDSARTQRPVT